MSDTPSTPAADEAPSVTQQMLGAQTLVLVGLMEIMIQKGVSNQDELLAMLDWCKDNARGQPATTAMLDVFRGSVMARPQRTND